ncbi:MAG: hypothetical protein ABSG68_06805 [Thermoguttaceae bacterium]|jgi:hypothetical protein
MLLDGLDAWGGLFSMGAPLLSIGVLMYLGGWSVGRTIPERTSLALGKPSARFWLAAIPVVAGIIVLALLLILSVLLVAMPGGVWLGSVGI